MKLCEKYYSFLTKITLRGSHDLAVLKVIPEGTLGVSILYLNDPNKDQEFSAEIIFISIGEEIPNTYYKFIDYVEINGWNYACFWR